MADMPVFLDNNSTTALDPTVLEKMLPYFSNKYGNASSKTHAYGWIAEEAVRKARVQVASLMGALAEEIVFTSGATEAVNLALLGYYGLHQATGNHIISVQTEHLAVLDTLAYLENKGATVTLLPVDREGLLDISHIEQSLTPQTIMIVAMAANNETGVMHNIEVIGELAKRHDILFFCDATQAVGKSRLQVKEINAGMVCLSAHKIYGPKGIGALYISKKNPRVRIAPLMHGGGHEQGLRPGTLNVPGIVGLGEACELTEASWWNTASFLSAQRTFFEQQLMDEGGVFINGSTRNRLPNTTNLLINGVRAGELIRAVPELAFSTGSACSSANPEPSHVLVAMGLTKEEVACSVRISLGKYNTGDEIRLAAESLKKAIRNIRKSTGYLTS